MNAFYRTILDEIRGYFMSEKIKIFALGGLDEEGKCLNCVQINNDIFVVDCGALPPDKTMPGVDYLIPNHDFLTEHKDQVRPIFFSMAMMTQLVPCPLSMNRPPRRFMGLPLP